MSDQKLPRLFWKPQIYLVAATEVRHQEFQDFLRCENLGYFSFSENSHGPEQAIEIGGRVCYLSFKSPRPGGNSEYLKHIIESGHGSCLEHATFMVICTGVSRSLTHQLIRHRVGISPSQLSQRFVDGGTRGMVVRPGVEKHIKNAIFMMEAMDGNYGADWSKIDMDSSSRGQEIIDHFLGCQKLYRKIQKLMMDSGATRKQANENARSVLPESAETIISLTMNARSARHLMEIRGDPAADAEIVRFSRELFSVLSKEFPSIFFDMNISGDHITSLNRKV